MPWRLLRRRRLREIVKGPRGLGRSKARDISACMRILKEQYGGQVPETFDDLLKLPGVGRKSANLIMGDVFGKPAIVTDTHCIRLVNRMGLVEGIKDPKKVEMALWKLIPPKEGQGFLPPSGIPRKSSLQCEDKAGLRTLLRIRPVRQEWGLERKRGKLPFCLHIVLQKAKRQKHAGR